MSANTIERNQRSSILPNDGQPVWLFGYGSLIHKVDFPYLEARKASIEGWTRRFWQGSHDHRGTPDSPGLVVTLIPDADALCTGIAYRVTPDVFSHLDVREKNGYLRLPITMTLTDDTRVDGLVYIATSDNPAFEGPADNSAIAERIVHCSGPSGPNSHYALRLARALRDMDVADEHVFAVERQILSRIEADHEPR